jgi:hypothetical protein
MCNGLEAFASIATKFIPAVDAADAACRHHSRPSVNRFGSRCVVNKLTNKRAGPEFRACASSLGCRGVRRVRAAAVPARRAFGLVTPGNRRIQDREPSLRSWKGEEGEAGEVSPVGSQPAPRPDMWRTGWVAWTVPRFPSRSVRGNSKILHACGGVNLRRARASRSARSRACGCGPIKTKPEYERAAPLLCVPTCSGSSGFLQAGLLRGRHR